MTQPCRLPMGGRIDRSRPLDFRFDGRSCQGYAGDTLASALLANGVHLVGRSFKYHRPRGILSAGAEEPNALVQLGVGARTEPNARATQVDLYEGLVAASQNRWPSLRYDVGAASNLLSGLFPAGFYYKTFMWPESAWLFYERWIRRAAGLGKAPLAPDPDRYEHRHAHADVLVVGGGPAGLAAALAAGRTGARVLLADEQAEFGGYLLGDDAEINGARAMVWVANTVALLDGMSGNVTLLPRTTIAGYYDGNFLVGLERVADHVATMSGRSTPRQRLWKIRARQVVLAAGAIERPLVFAGNDRPGIMLAGAVRSYLNRYAVLPGRRVVVVTNDDSAYKTAMDLAAADAEVIIVDLRSDPGGGLTKAARARDIEVLGGHAAVATGGGSRVSSVVVQQLNADGTAVVGARRRLAADLVAMSNGWSPNVHLFSQSRGRLRFDEALESFVPGEPFQATRVAGGCNGALTLQDCLRQGAEAGAAAARDAGFGDGIAGEVPQAAAELARAPRRPLWLVPPGKRRGREPKRFVDFQNDVTAADIQLAVREGYGSVEHLKRYTTLGMGTDQGKTSNVNALAVMSEVAAASIPEVGHTTYRPPYTPLTFGAIAGRDLGPRFEPERLTPMHGWHVAHGAMFEDVSQWKRPRYYPRGGETMRQAVDRECLAARSGIGILDASTLGKIDIQGRDAVELLNRVYVNGWSKLGVGRCRYGVMLNEQGMIFDDGVTTRLGERHFHMTTTTGGAARVLDWLEEWLQTEWTGLEVYCTSVTEQWAVASICGPRCRDLLAGLADIDLSPEAFPFLSMREGRVAGIPARVFRISFTGELSYEINVPARYGLALWDALMDAGRAFDICPYGTEAMHVLRAEKGFIIVDQETDGTTTPDDIGMAGMVSRQKDFLGRRSLARVETARAGRKQLVGLLTDDPHIVLPEGAQLIEAASTKRPLAAVGHVTSSYPSANLGRSIALALVRNGRARLDEPLYAPLLDGRLVRVKVVEPVFYDRDGARARG